MNNKTKIIIIGSAALSLLIMLRVITERDHRIKSDRRTEIIIKDGKHHALLRNTEHFTLTNNTFQASDQPTSVHIHFDPRGTNEIMLIDRMNEELLSLGIQCDERTIQKLVLARVEGAAFYQAPESWQQAIDVKAMTAVKLKNKIAWLLATTNQVIEVDGTTNFVAVPRSDELIISRIFDAPIGLRAPPHGDWVFRDRGNAVFEEIEAMERN